jgi:hypothetical protein
MMKRLGWILLLAAIGITDILLYRSYSLYAQVKERMTDIDKKIALLDTEQAYLPLNDLLYHEMGKVYLEAGSTRLQDAGRRDENFHKAYQSFIRSLTLNPLSSYAHFDFAQALQYMNFLNLPFQENYFEEYKKAALLSGQDIQIYAEVGRIMFSRWAALTPEDKEFTLDIVRRVLLRKEPDTIAAFLQIWDLNVKDYGVLTKILPLDAGVDLQTAQFLGEKSLSREERLKFMTQAETLQFRKAKEEYMAGQTDFNGLKLQEAKVHFQAALAGLQWIVFYQNLTAQNPIDGMEYKNLLKSAHLGLAKCILEESRRLDEALDHLYAYLNLEDELSSAADVETFLRERGLIEAKSGGNFQDFGRFAFELYLGYKQNRYREIVQAGQSLERSLLVIPDKTKQDYARVLELVADAYQKLDYLYESNKFYQKALDMGVQKIDLLMKMRKNFERLNDADKMMMIDKDVASLVEFKEMKFPGLRLNKGEPFSQKVILNGRKFHLTLSFEDSPTVPHPLVSIMFNGQMVWEDYLQTPDVSLILPSDIGPNTIQVNVINKPVTLLLMKISADEEQKPAKKDDISLNRKRNNFFFMKNLS